MSGPTSSHVVIAIVRKQRQPGLKTISTTITSMARFSKRLTATLRGAVSSAAAVASSPRLIAASIRSPRGAQYKPPSTGKSRNNAVDATTQGSVI